MTLREKVKDIGDSLRYIVMYSLASLIMHLAPHTTNGDIWVAGLLDIMRAELEYRETQ